jgi:uncharacterized protein (TIGR03083 family)
MLVATSIDVWTDVHQERLGLLGLLGTLTPPQWETESLCSEWRVRDVVGHMISETTMTVPNLLAGAISAGFRINRFIAKDARRQGTNAIPVLLEQFRAAVPTQTHLPGLSALSMLEDIVIHSLDIRRPLKVRQTIPESRMILVVGDLWTSRFFPGYKLFAGLRAEATDADWSGGEGPTVSGTIEDLALAMSGRLRGIDTFKGEGMGTLGQRMRHL